MLRNPSLKLLQRSPNRCRWILCGEVLKDRPDDPRDGFCTAACDAPITAINCVAGWTPKETKRQATCGTRSACTPCNATRVVTASGGPERRKTFSGPATPKPKKWVGSRKNLNKINGKNS